MYMAIGDNQQLSMEDCKFVVEILDFSNFCDSAIVSGSKEPALELEKARSAIWTSGKRLHGS